MRLNPKLWFVLFSGALLIAGCNSKELSRGKAKDILQASPDLSPGQSAWMIDQKAFQCGIANGLWPGSFQYGYNLNPSVRPYVASLNDGDGIRKRIVLAKKMEREVIEITGITDAPAMLGPNTKTVNYTWHWRTEGYKKDYPPTLVQCLGPLSAAPVSAEVVMKLYDDGWRIEHITF